MFSPSLPPYSVITTSIPSSGADRGARPGVGDVAAEEVVGDRADRRATEDARTDGLEEPAAGPAERARIVSAGRVAASRQRQQAPRIGGRDVAIEGHAACISGVSMVEMSRFVVAVAAELFGTVRSAW